MTLRIGVVMYQTSKSKGQELVAQNMVREFRNQGSEAYLITSIFADGVPVVGPSTLDVSGGFVHIFDEELGIPLIRVDSYSPTWPPRRVLFRDFVGTLDRLVDDLKLNVIITHSTLWNGPEETARFIEWRKKAAMKGSLKPVPAFCHMSHFQEPSGDRYDVEERSYRDAWNKIILKQLFNAADFLLTTTPYETDEMVSLGVPREKCLLFPGGIYPPEPERISEYEVRFRHGLPLGSRLVTTLGTVEERKNTMKVVEISKAFLGEKEVHFVIIGRAEGEYADMVRAEADLAENVSLVGEVSEDEKSALILASSANIIMSRSEALGLAQLEFMSAGVPVVTSGVGGQRWLVRNGKNGFVVDGPDDTKGATRALAKLLNSKRTKRMRMNASKFARNFEMNRLVSNLSKRLVQTTERRSAETLPRVASDEKTIEAWDSDGKRLLATNKRLVFSSSKNLKNVVSIPYGKVYGINPVLRAPWGALCLGGVSSLIALGGLLAYPSLSSTTIAVAPSSLLGVTSWLLPRLWLAPLSFGILYFIVRTKRGFQIQWEGGKVFLPRSFSKALRLAERLVNYDLLGDPRFSDDPPR